MHHTLPQYNTTITLFTRSLKSKTIGNIPSLLNIPNITNIPDDTTSKLQTNLKYRPFYHVWNSNTHSSTLWL